MSYTIKNKGIYEYSRPPKRCPKCNIILEKRTLNICPYCKQTMHNKDNCEGCIYFLKYQKKCEVYFDMNNPILNKDGTCLSYKKAKEG